ncbi:MAG: superoxide dismutase family protein [Chloroflexi bacterium]|nr:superoxide dismutase family protein [Chloroflexota bacterium]
MHRFPFRPARGAATLLLAVGALAIGAVFAWSPADAGQRREAYRADLMSLNPGVGGSTVQGKAKITIMGDTIRVNLKATGLAPGVHAMHIHAAASCPDAADDANNDGVVDVIEGLPDYGAILVPLDSNLTSQADGMFPMADSRGRLRYDQTDDLNAMLADLSAVDPNTGDAVIKLAPGEALNLAGRHIVIHGVDPSTTLPSTTATLGTLPPQATLPVACGEITAS